MRRSAVVLLTLVFALSTGMPDASAAQIFGTNEDDELSGTAAGDLIFGRGGKDRIVTSSEGGTVYGGPGADRFVGGPLGDGFVDDDGTRRDVLQSGGGGDFLVSADGAKDKVRCGKGKDIAIVDRGDDTGGCETVRFKTGTLLTSYLVMGTNDADEITSPAQEAVIFGKGGDDTITLEGSSSASIFLGSGVDQATGSTSTDTFVDEDGEAGDSMVGGDREDWFFSADGAADTIDCGGPNPSPQNQDQVWADEVDTLVDCDSATVHRAT